MLLLNPTTADSLFYIEYNVATNTLSGKTNLATPPINITGNVRNTYGC